MKLGYIVLLICVSWMQYANGNDERLKDTLSATYPGLVQAATCTDPLISATWLVRNSRGKSFQEYTLLCSTFVKACIAVKNLPAADYWLRRAEMAGVRCDSQTYERLAVAFSRAGNHEKATWWVEKYRNQVKLRGFNLPSGLGYTKKVREKIRVNPPEAAVKDPDYAHVPLEASRAQKFSHEGVDASQGPSSTATSSASRSDSKASSTAAPVTRNRSAAASLLQNTTGNHVGVATAAHTVEKMSLETPRAAETGTPDKRHGEPSCESLAVATGPKKEGHEVEGTEEHEDVRHRPPPQRSRTFSPFRSFSPFARFGRAPRSAVDQKRMRPFSEIPTDAIGPLAATFGASLIAKYLMHKLLSKQQSLDGVIALDLGDNTVAGEGKVAGASVGAAQQLERKMSKLHHERHAIQRRIQEEIRAFRNGLQLS
mmetsp:Transcript_33957/g.65632  ORF Transcript_33957/g.65632 Transcript_33957/m.65632 type:complete len:427 (+) Transcript_33957:79-1359(+)